MAELVALVMVGALAAYAATGGADFGGGVWDLLASGPRREAQRNLIATAIAPIWEANHVWLILMVVILFVALPSAFAAIMTALHIPLVIVLIGIVLRGAAFVFRSYDPEHGEAAARWRRVFAIASLITPLFLGVSLGAIASGEIRIDAAGHVTTDFVSAWCAPFPFSVGVFVVILVSWLAAVYLAAEAQDPRVAEDFRVRALASGALAGVAGNGLLLMANAEVPHLALGLMNTYGGVVIQLAVLVTAILALQAVWVREYGRARGFAAAQVALVVIGLGVAQYPYVVPPDLTFADALAPRSVVEAMLIALAIGVPILLVALAWLYRVFKARR